MEREGHSFLTTFPARMNYTIMISYTAHTSTVIVYCYTTVTSVLETSTKSWDVERKFNPAEAHIDSREEIQSNRGSHRQ